MNATTANRTAMALPYGPGRNHVDRNTDRRRDVLRLNAPAVSILGAVTAAGNISVSGNVTVIGNDSMPSG
ncbi:MAG: hypothetical protein ACJ796_19005 [Gemmatimonadaceae bacterium]